MSYQALLFCPDDKTARVVTQVLTELDFTVEPCNEPFAAVKKLMAQHFDAIVVDCDNEQNAALLFKSARNSATNQSSLSVAVVEGQAGVAKAFRIGANLVLTKPINVEQSKGTLRVARGLLRKADTSRPAGIAAPSQEHAVSAVTTPTPARPFAPSTPGLKSTPSFSSSPKAPAAPAVPVATQSGFEVENDPVPAPDSSEAALLESMPDPVYPVSQPQKPPAGMTKEYPWQPMAKPISEPMASALRRAEEAAHKPSASVPPTVSEPDYSLSAADLLGEGAGTATAPAREKEILPMATALPTSPASLTPAAPSSKEFGITEHAEPSKKVVAISDTAPAIEPPTFSAYSIKDHEELPEEGSSKNKIFLIVAAAVLIAAAYFGWTKMQSATQPGNAVKQVVPATSQAVASPASTVQPSALSQPPTVGTTGSPSEIVEPPSSSQHVASSTGAKPSPATKTSGTAPADKEQDVIVRQMPEETLVVKNAPVQKTPKPAAVDAPQPAAPEALGITTNSDDKAISGLVSSAPVSVPKAVAPQSVRVSQGVSQGLLFKRVQPAYPPQAMQMRLQGAVQLQATISKDGSVTNVKTLSGDGILARAASEAVKQWKYKPYFLNGEPVEIQTQITVNFKLP